jgi:putative ABC transport system permease protein
MLDGGLVGVGNGYLGPMIFTLAKRNLLHEPGRLAVTLVGIAFSVVLIAVQAGLFLGFEKMVSVVIDHLDADIIIMPSATENFDDVSVLSGEERYRVLGVKGVRSVERLVVTGAEWLKPDGGTRSVMLLGSDPRTGSLAPWNIASADAERLTTPGSVILDSTYADDLGVTRLGDVAQINGQSARVIGFTAGIRSFTTIPYVFAALDQAQSYQGSTGDRVAYLLVKVNPGADIKTVQSDLAERVKTAKVMTLSDFRTQNFHYWLLTTGAGGALLIGVLIGILVGCAVVGQTLFSTTKDHLPEFATLRALGAPARLIQQVILWQAAMSGIAGYIAGGALVALVVAATQATAMSVVVTPGMAAGLFVVTIVMCAVAALAAILKVNKIDPATVFAR